MSSEPFLEEKDIPGASLCGRKPSELRTKNLNFGWDVEVIRAKASKPKPNLWRGMTSIAAITVILQVTWKIFSRLIFIRFLYQGRRVHQDREGQKYRGSWSKWSIHQAKTTTHWNWSYIECSNGFLIWWCEQQRTPYCQSIPLMDGVCLWKRCLCSPGQKWTSIWPDWGKVF